MLVKQGLTVIKTLFVEWSLTYFLAVSVFPIPASPAASASPPFTCQVFMRSYSSEEMFNSEVFSYLIEYLLRISVILAVFYL